MFGGGETGRPVLDETRKSAVAAYRAEIKPILDDGASVVALGLKAGMSDISAHAYPAEVLTSMADGWVRALEAVRADAGKILPAAEVADVHWLFLRSLDGYVQTAQALRVAASADATRQPALVELAASLGRSSDLLFDRAEATLDRLDARPTTTTPE